MFELRTCDATVYSSKIKCVILNCDCNGYNLLPDISGQEAFSEFKQGMNNTE